MSAFKELNTLKDGDLIFKACKDADVESVRKYLQSGGSAYAASENNANLAAYALDYGHVDVVAVMLDFDFKINDPINRFGETPLGRAASKNHRKLTEFLIRKGADVNYRADDHAVSAFLQACGGSQVEIVRLMLEAGGDVNDRRYKGCTPLREAARNNQVAIMGLLHQAGANIDDPDHTKTTPLIGCAKGGKLEAVQWLLEHGADINAEDERGKTALDWAKANGHAKLVEVLQKHLGK
jgi:ankyrin repeat protein